MFQHEAYTRFCAQVRDVIGPGGEGERPTKLAMLTQAIPELADYLRSSDARSEARGNELKAAMDDIVTQQRQQLQHNAQGAELLQWLAQSLARLPQQLLRPGAMGGAAGAGGAVGEAGEAVDSCYTLARASLAPSLAPSPPDTNGPSAVATAEGPPEPLEPPSYRMCRSVKTVEALWREWTVGLNGQPSVSALDSRWGNRWRAGRQAEL